MKTDQGKVRAKVQKRLAAAPASGRKGAGGRLENRAGRPTLEELERRKAKVMQVATSLFVRHGYAATSRVDIAKSAGVATRTVYQHFGDKEAIFRSVMFARETAAVFPPPQPATGASLFETMLQMARYVSEVTYRPSTVDLMRLAIAESRRFPELTKKVINASYARFRENVKAVFDELAARGAIKDLDTGSSAEMFIHLMLGDTPLLVFAGWKPPALAESHVTEKLDLFILGRWGPATATTARQTLAVGDPPRRPRRRLKAPQANGG